MPEAARQSCFVDMPFGHKADSVTGQFIDFDQVFNTAIKPAIEEAGLAPIRGDQESTGGIIHKAMFARLLLSEFVIADMTTANANVFYELGVRHTAKPQTTIPIFATLGAPPFDVNMIRAIPYDLVDGKLDEAGAAALKDALVTRMRDALQSPVAADSPLFELFPDFPGIEMSHELTDVFRDRVEYSEDFKTRLAEARGLPKREDAIAALQTIEAGFGDISTVERGVLIDLYLSYRAVEAYDEMIALYDKLPATVQAAAIARQQLAFALNRRGQGADKDTAIRTLQKLIEEQGESAESYGILGRVYKDKYEAAKAEGSRRAAGFLDLAIEAYTAGFEAEPADYYPGVNAITLLLVKGDEASVEQAHKLEPLVTFAAVRRGGAEADDYWTVATVLELSAIGGEYDRMFQCLDRAIVMPDLESFMPKTTAKNLRLIQSRAATEEDAGTIGEAITVLETLQV